MLSVYSKIISSVYSKKFYKHAFVSFIKLPDLFTKRDFIFPGIKTNPPTSHTPPPTDMCKERIKIDWSLRELQVFSMDVNNGGK